MESIGRIPHAVSLCAIFGGLAPTFTPRKTAPT
jgi:hypothetical protein